MSGCRVGCCSVIKENAPVALYTHCAAHRLNLVVVAACKIQDFRNTESFIWEIARFFKWSPKRQRLLDKTVELLFPKEKAKKLKDACRTRWIQRIDSYIVFLELFPAVNIALSGMIYKNRFENLGSNWNWDSETLTKASGFLKYFESSSFLISFKILLEVMVVLRGLTIKLQNQAEDILNAFKEVNMVIFNLKEMLENSKNIFMKIFDDSTSLGKEINEEDFEISVPRVYKRVVNKTSANSVCAMDYFREKLFCEFISHVIADLQSRFIENPSHCYGLFHLMPNICKSVEDYLNVPNELMKAVEFYNVDIPQIQMFEIEYRMWILKWKYHDTEVPVNLVDTLKACDATSFPNIHILFHLALTFPITSCESERSFSQLKLIKTAIRSLMSSERLSGLAIIKINRDYCEKLQHSSQLMMELVNEFTQLHPRQMKLNCILKDY